jgi:hypothetical protein
VTTVLRVDVGTKGVVLGLVCVLVIGDPSPSRQPQKNLGVWHLLTPVDVIDGRIDEVVVDVVEVVVVLVGSKPKIPLIFDV